MVFLSLLSIKKIPDLADFAEVVTKWLEKLANCMRSGRRRWNVDIIQTSTWSYNFSAQGNFIWQKKVLIIDEILRLNLLVINMKEQI